MPGKTGTINGHFLNASCKQKIAGHKISGALSASACLIKVAQHIKYSLEQNN